MAILDLENGENKRLKNGERRFEIDRDGECDRMSIISEMRPENEKLGKWEKGDISDNHYSCGRPDGGRILLWENLKARFDWGITMSPNLDAFRPFFGLNYKDFEVIGGMAILAENG